MTNKQLSTMRLVFRAAKVAMDYQFETTGIKTTLHALHEEALSELEKDAPDMSILDGILEKMQDVVGQQHKPKKFQPGGIVRPDKGFDVDDVEYVVIRRKPGEEAQVKASNPAWKKLLAHEEIKVRVMNIEEFERITNSQWPTSED